MSESPINLPAIRSSSVELMDRRTDSWTAVVEQVAVLATRISDTELVPKQLRGKPAAVAAVILYGREIGLPPMTALRTSYVVDGRVALAAETMRGLVLAAGHELIYREATTARCVAAGRRRGSETWSEVEWNLDIARAAGLLPADPRSGWTRYRRAMLKARATAELCRDVFPDVIGGFSAVEELDDEPRGDAEPAAPPRKLRRAEPRPEPAAEPPRPGPASSSGGVPLEPPHPSSPTDAEPPLAEAGSRVAGAGEVPLPGEEGYDRLGQDSAGRGDHPEEGDARLTSPGVVDDDAAPRGISQEPGPGQPRAGQRDTGPWKASKQQLAAMGALFHELGLDDRQDALTLTGHILNRPIETRKDLTREDYRTLMDALSVIRASEDPRAMVLDLVAVAVNQDEPEPTLDE